MEEKLISFYKFPSSLSIFLIRENVCSCDDFHFIFILQWVSKIAWWWWWFCWCLRGKFSTIALWIIFDFLKKMIVILQNGFLEIWWCNGSTTIILSFHLREREICENIFSEKLYNSIIIIILPAFGYNITNWCPLDNSSFLVTRILTIIMT